MGKPLKHRQSIRTSVFSFLGLAVLSWPCLLPPSHPGSIGTTQFPGPSVPSHPLAYVAVETAVRDGAIIHLPVCLTSSYSVCVCLRLPTDADRESRIALWPNHGFTDLI